MATRGSKERQARLEDDFGELVKGFREGNFKCLEKVRVSDGIGEREEPCVIRRGLLKYKDKDVQVLMYKFISA